MKRIIFCALFLSIFGQAAEWCPRHEGSFPVTVIDLGERQFYYFVTSGRIYSEQEQEAVVYEIQNRELINVDKAVGSSDWFSSTEYNGNRSGFSCDSQTMNFEYAWALDAEGIRSNYYRGEARAVGYAEHPLECSDY